MKIRSKWKLEANENLVHLNFSSNENLAVNENLVQMKI